ncbi:MAG: hypothetical protein MR299_07025 [Bacteroidales bacterium]|nr:hypothetical protein [Bacteroidales bacterium]
MNEFYKTKQGTCIYKPAWFHIHKSIDDQILVDALMNNEISIDEGYVTKQDLQITYNVGYPIGVSMCIECPQNSPHVYFKVRDQRQYQSRMIHGALPQETSYVTIILKPTNYGLNLITAWAGFPSKPELGNISYFERAYNPKEAVMESAEFWLNHALIDENPTAKELLIDIKIICERLGLDFDGLTASQISSILSARLGKDISFPEFHSEEELLNGLCKVIQ